MFEREEERTIELNIKEYIDIGGKGINQKFEKYYQSILSLCKLLLFIHAWADTFTIGQSLSGSYGVYYI